MPTYDLLLDDPSTWPSQVRTPDGSAPRNATTEAGGFQDLANRTAYLKALGPDRVGSVASMIGRAAPAEGDVYFTRENGPYTFTYAITSGPDPFVKPSTAVGVAGCWVSPLWGMLTGASDPAKVSQALIPLPPYPRLFSVGSGVCEIFGAGTQHITTSTYVQINDGANDLSTSIACTVGDRVRVSIGPIYTSVTTTAGQTTVNAHVIDGAANVDYPMRPAQAPTATAEATACGFLVFDHVVTTGPIAVYLQAKCSLGGEGYVHFEAFGPSKSQWIRYEVIR